MTSPKHKLSRDALARFRRRMRFFAVGLLVPVLALLIWRMFPDGARKPLLPIDAGAASGIPEFTSEPAFSPNATADDLTSAALRVVTDLERADPGSLAVLRLKARLFYSLRNVAEAVRLWEQCAQREPNNPEFVLGIGSVAKEMGDDLRAELMFRKTLALAPGNSSAVQALAETLLRQGKLREVVETLEEFQTTNRLTSAMADCLGQAHLQLKDFQKAREVLEEIVRLNPDHRAAYYGLSRAYVGLDRLAESREALQKFQDLAADGGVGRPAPSADTSFAGAGREDLVLSDLPLLRKIVVQTHWDAALVYRALGDRSKTEELWCRAIALDRNNIVIREELANWFLQSKREHEALQICEQLRDLQPDNAERWLDVGLLHARLDHLEAARIATARAIQIDPKNPKYRQALSLIKSGE